MSTDIREMVIQWLDDNVHFGDADEMISDDEASFLDGGILDSLGFVQLVLHLEDTFSIKLERKDLTRETFDSMAKVISYVSNHPDFSAS